jgi:hypothetical protein
MKLAYSLNCREILTPIPSVVSHSSKISHQIVSRFLFVGIVMLVLCSHPSLN